ncbi:MAG: hypothetical protein WA771_06900, partial [Chthoniobacterales bacterium]
IRRFRAVDEGWQLQRRTYSALHRRSFVNSISLCFCDLAIAAEKLAHALGASAATFGGFFNRCF